MICRTIASNDEINTALVLSFSDDPKNKYAIKCEDPRSMNNITTYMQKEAQDYYRYDPTGAIDYDLLPFEQPITQEKPKHCHLQNIINILEQEIISHRKAINKYTTLLNKSYT